MDVQRDYVACSRLHSKLGTEQGLEVRSPDSYFRFSPPIVECWEPLNTRHLSGSEYPKSRPSSETPPTHPAGLWMTAWPHHPRWFLAPGEMAPSRAHIHDPRSWHLHMWQLWQLWTVVSETCVLWSSNKDQQPSWGLALSHLPHQLHLLR